MVRSAPTCWSPALTCKQPQRNSLTRDSRLAGMRAYEALRIAARRPRFGLDTDHRTIPHEVGLDRVPPCT